MGLFLYSETTDDSELAAREAEANALEENIKLLEVAEQMGPNSMESVSALFVTRQVWTILIQDLGNPNNAMPDQLCADLISIGVWVLKECEAIRFGNSTNYKGIIDVTRIIKEGLV